MAIIGSRTQGFRLGNGNRTTSQDVMFLMGALCLISLAMFSGSIRTINQLNGTEPAKSPSYLDLPPSAKEIVLNIGSNRDPILPRKESGPCALTIAFEPIIPERVPAHAQVMVVPAAVSDSSSLATMYKYNKNAVSSSLSKAAKESFWNTGKKNMGIKIVPVVSMTEVLQSIPPDVTIDFIQTDAQGHDFSIIRAGIQEMRKRGVKFLKTEATRNDVMTYKGVENDLCLHWLPFMNAHGYSLFGIEAKPKRGLPFQSAAEVLKDCARQEKNRGSDPTAGLKEEDVLWKLSSLTEDVSESRFTYPVLSRFEPLFRTEDYDSCNGKSQEHTG